MKGTFIVMFGSLVLSGGCMTDAQSAKWEARKTPATIECYSGGTPIYKGRSTDKVLSEEGSDGYYFVDAADGLLREVSGDCIITYDSQIKGH